MLKLSGVGVHRVLVDPLGENAYIIETGTHDELISRDEVYSELYETQAQSP